MWLATPSFSGSARFKDALEHGLRPVPLAWTPLPTFVQACRQIHTGCEAPFERRVCGELAGGYGPRQMLVQVDMLHCSEIRWVGQRMVVLWVRSRGVSSVPAPARVSVEDLPVLSYNVIWACERKPRACSPDRRSQQKSKTYEPVMRAGRASTWRAGGRAPLSDRL